MSDTTRDITEGAPELETDDQGTVVLFTPRTAAALDWLRTEVHTEGWQWLGTSLAVDRRFAEGLIIAAHSEGLL